MAVYIVDRKQYKRPMREERQAMAKKYEVQYQSGATGYGWAEDFDSLAEVERFVNEMRHNCSAFVRVWDYGLGEFIFWKRAYSWEPVIDLLRNSRRDFRTKTRQSKPITA